MSQPQYPFLGVLKFIFHKKKILNLPYVVFFYFIFFDFTFFGFHLYTEYVKENVFLCIFFYISSVTLVKMCVLSFIVVIKFIVIKLPSRPLWLTWDWSKVIRLYIIYYVFIITLCTMFDLFLV